MTVIHWFSDKMGGIMNFFGITLVISVIGSNAAGEFSILHSPQSLKFSGSSITLESLLKEIFTASLGLSVEENADWDGLTIVDPFNTPEAVVEVYIDGVSSLGDNAGLKSKNFPLDVDEYEPDTFEAVKHRIKQRFTNGGNKIVNIRLSDPDDLTAFSDVFGKIVPPKLSKQTPYQYLKIDNDENYLFLYELEVLKLLTDKINSGVISSDNIVDYYNIRFRSLHALSDFHGPNSMQTKEAKKLLASALEKLSDAFVKAYDGSVLVAAVTTDVAHTRRVRAAPDQRNEDPISGRRIPQDPPPQGPPIAQDPPPQGPPIAQDPPPQGPPIAQDPPLQGPPNAQDPPPQGPPIAQDPPPQVAPAPPITQAAKPQDTSADFAAIFNIMLWFGVLFTVSLVAVVYAILDMDPGKDSIIYRMTSTRLKKDN